VCALFINNCNHCHGDVAEGFLVLWSVLLIITLPPEELVVLSYNSSQSKYSIENVMAKGMKRLEEVGEQKEN
jgi:hypothetical protein